MKGHYKLTDVGAIPQDWEARTLGEIAAIATGNTPSTNDASNYGDEYLFVSPVDMGDWKYIARTQKHLSTKGFAQSRRFPQGSVLFVCIGSTIGKCGIAPVDLTSNQQINALFPSSAVTTDYLYYAACSVARSVQASAGEQAVPIVNKSQFAQTLIAVPPITEQRAIADALSDVDALLLKLDQLIAKKRDLKKGAMQELLTGERRMPGFKGKRLKRAFSDIARPRADRIDPRKTAGHPVCVELEHIGQGTGSLLGHGVAGPESSLKSIFRAGDVLFGKLRAYLRKYWLADRDGVCSTEIWALVPAVDVVDPKFLFQIVQVDQFIDAASTAYGTHMPRSDWNVVKNYEVDLPPLDEQAAISSFLGDMDAEVAILEAHREKTRAIKQGMIQELLTGRIRLV